MGFMREDEHLILMDFAKANGAPMSPVELRQLREAGIETVQYCYTLWSQLEPVPGQYRWGPVEDRLGVLLEAGFKVLLMAYSDAPAWCPDDWYAKLENGIICRSVLSPWNAQAQAYSLEYLTRFRDRFSAPDVLVIDSYMSMGETVMPNVPVWYDDAALASFQNCWGSGTPMRDDPQTDTWFCESLVEMMGAQQAVLVENPWREIWTMLHPEIAKQVGLYGNGCAWIEPIYERYQTLTSNINQIWYTAIQHVRTYPDYARLIERFGLRAYGGAEYCEGLTHTVPFAKTHGFAGLIISPLHPFTHHLELQPWMLESIRKAVTDLA